MSQLTKKKFPSLVSIDTESDGNTSFLRAARNGQLDKVLEYLKSNIDINTSNTNGLNALHLASKDGHVDIVEELLKRGAVVDAATKKGNTALHIASLAGQEEVVKLLVQHGASVNVQSQNGFTPLYMAAQENHDNVVKFLLSNGANQSLSTEDGFTPLAVAMQQGHDKVVAVLLENDTRGKVRLPALHIAAKKDDVKAAKLLLENDHNADVTSKSGFTPLHIASHYGNQQIANLLIQKSADVNYAAKHNITPLHVAAKWGKTNMVSLLLENGATIEAKTRDGLTPLHCAARSGHEQVVDMLLERGAPISSKTKNGLAPLHMAAQGDHVDAARILLYHRAPVDEVTVDYLTALHVAAHCGHVRVAKLLLDRQADANARALNGFTPLHIACKKNRIKVVELLLKHGANISATTESGLTPLHVASFMGCMNIVIYLLQHDANPDVPTVRGETPLHLAARANQTDIIRILLRNGAQVDVRAREQQTPLHIASRLGNADIVALLLQHGAKVDNTTKDMYTSLHIAAKEGQDEVASLLWDNGASLHAVTKKGFTPLHLAAKYGHLKVVKFLLKKEAPVDAQGQNGVTPLHVALHYDHQDVASVLLDKGASPHSAAKNGHTPLHIAARKNQMDVANTLLEYGANPNAESKAGFTPLHLSSQEGHNDMAALKLEHKANVNHEAKNGLTPLHLCAQEDQVTVAEVLVKNGVNVNAATKTGYTPLHIACHYGQINMVRFLLQSGAVVESTTLLNYTPLHQAAQQGHANIVNILLDNKADPDATTMNGQTPIMIAQKLGYITVIENLKLVSSKDSSPKLNAVTSDEKYRVQAPELMHETFMSDSEEEGGEDTILGDHQTYRYLTADEMKSLGDDSLPIDVTRDERIDSNRMVSSMDNNTFPTEHIEDSISPEHITQNYVEYITKCVPDNTEIDRYPVNIGFLVSFLVDARGGAMRGCRHSGVRVIVPPRCAPSPTRITCRYVRPQRTPHPPPLMEGEALASRVLELGPVGAKFLGPVIIEVPHFAALRDKEREIVILRSDNGENWKEHTVEATEDMLNDVLQKNFEADDLNELEDVSSGRITRIVTQDFPQYFAVVSRIRQEVHAIGPEGGMVSSTVVPQVQAVFPEGALTKKIKVGLQAQPIDPELTAKLLGHGVAVSPVVTVEPRRRKFHKAITLTMPAPKAHSQGMINQYSGSAPTLRLLCSITGGTTRAQWEDVTGSTPLTFVNDCVSFTTTVSARFWLMDCRNISDATKMATELYKEAIHVPFMAKFVVFAKRVDPLEARLRVFCMTDDKEEKTLEHQENFTEVAKSRDVEVLEGKQHYIEFAGNLVPVTKSGEQLSFCFRAFKENRLPFTVRVKDQHAEAVSRCLFMKEPKVPKGEQPQQPICILNIVLPDDIVTDTVSLTDSDSYKKYTIISDYHRPDPRIADMSNLLGEDWVPLANQLGLTTSEINVIKSEYPESTAKQAQSMLRMWLSQSGSKAQMNTLENALRRIGREDIITHCLNVDHSIITRINRDYAEPYKTKKEKFEKEIIVKKQIIPKMAREEEEDEKKPKTRDKYSAEEKEQPEEEEVEEEEEEESFDKPVSERRQKIEKRLSAERAIPASSQRREIVQEITSIKQQNLVEDKLAEVQQKVLEHEEKSKTVLTKTVMTTKQDNKTLSKEEKKSPPPPILETMKSLADEAHKTVEEKFMKGVTQRLEQNTTSLSTTYEAQKSPKLSKTPPPSPADFLFREQAHASQEWESQKDEFRVNKLDGNVDKKETCNVHLTEAQLTTQSMPLPKPRSKTLDTTDFHSLETEMPTKPKSPVRDDLLDEDEVPESYSDKKKFWENVTQDHSHKRYSLQDTVLSDKESFKRKQLSVQDFASGPVPKPRTLHSSQSLVETDSSLPQEQSENTSSKTSDEDISTQERRQKNILAFDLKLTQKKSQDKKKKVSTDELAQKGSGQNSENLGYISDSEDVEHYISDSEIEDRVPQIRDRMMSVFVPSASSTACRSIYERSASLPTEDLYEVSARTIKARKEYYEEQIRKEMIEEQLTSEIEEEPSPERKNLLLSSTEEDHTEADARSIGEDVEDIKEEHTYDAKKKIETKSNQKLITEERISSSNSSKTDEHKIHSDYMEEMSFIQKSKLNEPRNGISRITHEDFQLKDVDKDNEHKLFETQHSISSDKSGDHIDEQNFRDDSHSTKPDSMEVLVDKSELEDSEKLADLDQDIEGKSVESLDIDESPKQINFGDTELKNGHFNNYDTKRDKGFEEYNRDVNIKVPQENVHNVVWEVSLESGSKTAFTEKADDLHVQEVVRVTEKCSEGKSVSKIPVLKKNEQIKSTAKEIIPEGLVTDKKNIEKQSKIPKAEAESSLLTDEQQKNQGELISSDKISQKVLDETGKLTELESQYNPDYSTMEHQKKDNEQAKISKYSNIGLEPSDNLEIIKKDMVTKVAGDKVVTNIDQNKMKDDIQSFIESDYTKGSTKVETTKEKEILDNKIREDTETFIKLETKHLTDIDSKCQQPKMDDHMDTLEYLNQEKIIKQNQKDEIVSDFDKIKLKSSTKDFLENETKHYTDYISVLDKFETDVNSQIESIEVIKSSKETIEKELIGIKTQEQTRQSDIGNYFEHSKLKTDTIQFLESESIHLTDYTKSSSENVVLTQKPPSTSSKLSESIEGTKVERNGNEKMTKPTVESENLLLFDTDKTYTSIDNSQIFKDNQILNNKCITTTIDLEKANLEDSEKNIDKKVLQTTAIKHDIAKFIESESKHSSDYNTKDSLTKTTTTDSTIKPLESTVISNIEDKHNELKKAQDTAEVTQEKQQINSNNFQTKMDIQRFIETESLYNTDFSIDTTNTYSSALTKSAESYRTEKLEEVDFKKCKLHQENIKDHPEKVDEVQLSKTIDSDLTQNYETGPKCKKDKERQMNVDVENKKSEVLDKLGNVGTSTGNVKNETDVERKTKSKTDTQSHSEIEKLIFDCLQQQKVHPDEALKIANTLVEEIEAEIQKHDSLGTEPIEKLEEKTNIPEFLRHLAETKGLDQREVELVESVLARKKKGIDKLSRGDTQASSMEITDEDLKYSGTDLEYSQVLEQQIDQLEAEKVSNLDSESFEDPSENSQSKTTFIEKTGEEHSENTEWSHDYGGNEDTNILAMKKDGFMKTHENIVCEKIKMTDDRVCSDDDKSISEKTSEESDILKTKIETVIAEDSHILLKDKEITACQTGSVQVEAAHISNIAHDKIKIMDKDKSAEVMLEQKQIVCDDKVSAVYNAETHQVEMSKDTLKQINKITEEKYDELNKEQEKVLKKESVSIQVADDGSQIQTKEDIDTSFSVKSSTTITQTHQREETSTTVTENTEMKGNLDDELLKELESGEVKTIFETHEVVRRTSSNELKDIGYSKKDDSDSPSVVLRKSKSDTSSSSPKTKPDRKSGYDYEINSSSGESHYQSFEMDSNKSRPCSSDIEGLMAAGSSEYESALTSQIYSAKSQISTDYKTVSSMSSKDSMKSLDSESSGNLASVEISEHSETLVPSTSDLDDILDSVDHQLLADESEINEQNLVWSNRSVDTHHLYEVSDSEGLSFTGVDESMEVSEEESPEMKVTEIQSKMKRSCEMTFQPEPKILAPESPHADSEDKIGTSLDDGSIFSTSMSSTSSTGAQRTVIEQSRADSDKLEGSMNVSSEHLSLEDVDSIPRGSIDSVIVTSNLTTSGSPTTLHAGFAETITNETIGDGNQIINGNQLTDETITSATSSSAPEPKKKGHKRTESTVLMGTLTRFSSEQPEGEKIGSQLNSKEISFEDMQNTDEKEKCDTRTSSQVSSLDKESDMSSELFDGLKSQSQLSKSDFGQPVTFSDNKFNKQSTNLDKSTDISERRSVTTSASSDLLVKFRFDDISTQKSSTKECDHKDRERLHEIHHEKKTAEEGEAEAVFSMVPPISPAHKIKEIQPILEDDVAEKHELEIQERIKKDSVLVTTAILKDTSPVPDITITQHMAPLVDNNFHYPELELESKEKQLEQQQEVQTDTPQTPASNSSKSSDETDQGREYVVNETVATIPEEPEGIVEETKKSVDDKQAFKEKRRTDSPDSSDSFEMLEKPDLIDDFVVIEEVGKEAHELDTEGKSVKIAKTPKPAKKHDEEVEQYLAHSAPTPLTRMTDIKYYPDGSSTEGAPFDFEESPPQIVQGKTKKDYDSQYDRELEANRKWVEQQFQGDQATMMAAGYGYEMDFERGPLEDIKEEDITDFAASSYGSQKDSGGSVKESYSSTPEYDVLAGRKYFTRSGEHDDTSMSSLQEFENLEQAMSLEMRRLHQGSQDSSSNGSFKTRYIISKSGQGDDISVSSLKEFEGLEKACIAAHKIEIKVKEEEALLAQIDEGQESIASESESCETISGTEKKAVNDTDEEDYEKRMFEIDEIIKQAQSNVERFIDLKDVEQTESLGRGDSIEEVSKVPDLDLDTPLVKSTIKVQWKENEDVMMTSTDSLEQQIGHSSRHDSADSLDQETAGNIMTTSTDSIEAHLKKSSKDNAVSDSIEGHLSDKNYIVSSDSLELAAAVQPTDNNALMTDSIDEDSSKFGPYDHSTSSTGKDLNSSTKDDFSHDKDDEHQADNFDISSSTATHATYQYETDSVFSGSFTSGGSNTMVSSTNSLDQARLGTGVDIAVAVRKVWFDEDNVDDNKITEIVDESSKPYVTEIIEPSTDDYYSHVIHRKVELPPEVRKITFTGADADEQMKKFLEEFKEGEECEETEEIDSDGNIHIRKVLTRRIVVKDDGGQQSGPEIEEYFRQLNQPDIVKGKGIIGTNLNDDKEGKQQFAAASTSKSFTKHSRDLPEASTSSEQPAASSIKAEGEEGSEKEEIDKKTDQHQ